MKKIVLILLMAALLILSNCSDSTSSSNSDFVGVWNMKDGDVQLKITTNSDQKGINLMEEGNGSIEVTGDITKTLKYLVNQYGYMIASEYSAYSEITFMSGISINFDGTSAMLTCYDENNPMISAYYQCDNANYSYDENTYTLTVEPTTLYKLDLTTYETDSSTTVQISGTLQSSTIEFKAGESQSVEWLDTFGSEDATIAIEEDGTYTITDTDTDGETTITTGTWENSDGKLVFTEEDEDLGMEIEYIMDYKFDGDDLILKYEMDFCTIISGSDVPNAGCYSYIENILMIESGSISDAMFDVEMKLSAK